MVVKNIDVKIAEELVYVSMADENLYAKSVKELQNVSIIDEKINAKTVKELLVVLLYQYNRRKFQFKECKNN